MSFLLVQLQTGISIALQTLAEKHWDAIIEKNAIKKRKKFCDYLLRKGWESNLVYEKVKQLEDQFDRDIALLKEVYEKRHSEILAASNPPAETKSISKIFLNGKK